MRKRKSTPEQVLQTLRQTESGMTVVNIRRKLGVTETSLYRWKKQYTGLDVSELRELKKRDGLVIKRKNVRRLYLEEQLRLRRGSTLRT